MEERKISITTSFFNKVNFVEKTAQVVLNQNYSNWQWIITDDGSTDGTRSKVKDLPKLDKRIIYVEQNRKREMFWNPMKWAEDGDIIVMLDSDDAMVPNSLSMINYYFNFFPEVLFLHHNSTAYWDAIPYDTGGDLIKGFDHLVYCSKNYDSILDGMLNLSPFDPHIYGSLYAFKKIPIEFPEHEFIPGNPFPSNDLQMLLMLEERGLGMFVPRTFHIQRKIRNSENQSNWSVAGEMILIEATQKRRKNMSLSSPRRIKYFDDIYAVAESTYISRLNYEFTRKKIGFINFDLTPEQKEKVKILFHDHDCIFDLNDADYYFINIPPNTKVQEFNNLFNTVLGKSKETVTFLPNKRMTYNFDYMAENIKKCQPHHMFFGDLNRHSFYFMFNWAKPELFELRKVEIKQPEKTVLTVGGGLTDLYESITQKDTKWSDPVIFAPLPKPKIKLVHLMSKPMDKREVESYDSLHVLKDFGIDYIQKINKPYDGEVPGNSICPDSGKGHYGNYLAFKGALEEFTDDTEFLMICECDCILEIPPDKFMDLLYKVCDVMKKENISYFSFGDRIHLGDGTLVSPIVRDINDFMYETDKIICCHMILFPKSIKDFLVKSFNEKPWGSADLFFNSVFKGSPYKMGIIKNRVAAQTSGFSLLDNEFKPYQPMDSMANNLISLYNELKVESKPTFPENFKSTPPDYKLPIPQPITTPVVSYHFVNGPAMKIISGPPDADYELLFIDQDTDKVLDQVRGREHQSKIEYFVNWKLQAKMNGVVFFEHLYNAKDQEVYIHIDSTTLGDTIAWFPYVEEFRKKHNAKVTVSSHWNQLFEGQYPELKFVSPGSTVFCYAMYKLGAWSEIGEKIPSDWRLGSLLSVATRLLGLPYKEIKAKINVPKNYPLDWDKLRKGKTKKYICLCDRTTMEPRKTYEYWQSVVDYFSNVGYVVVALDKQGTSLKRVIKVSPGPIDKIIAILNNSELVLGVSAGLTWLSWAIGKPTIMVSSATAPDAEFENSENAVKLINTSKCHGCFNDINLTNWSHGTQEEKEKSKGRWAHGGICLRDKNFECRTSVNPEEVIKWANKFLEIED